MDKRYDFSNDSIQESIEAREFILSRAKLNKFKPMPVADVRIARCCENCAFNKGFPIHDGSEFFEYGQSFYYGFIACTLKGREAEKCMVTDRFGVCKHHKFREDMKGFCKGKPRPLAHLEKCIEQKMSKQENTK